jgi:phage baseplate assembly protein W
MPLASKDFLGVGWRFPVSVNERRGLALSHYEKNIEECIWIILGTAKGERVMRPDFGCDIHELVFAPNNAETHGMIITAVTEALVRWEPRIMHIHVDVAADPDHAARLLVNVQYEVRATNNTFNLVYPFYLQKGELR